ncbi:MAG: hypothetical protein D6706_00925 [Chloroflexi bacterium]|nr:MAG: hypothetical protein D6706_00925 [Chloroflexota bacterium]
MSDTRLELTGSGELPLMEEQSDHEQAHFDIVGVFRPQNILQGKPPVLEEVNFHLHLSSDSEGKLRMIIPNFGTQESGFPINPTDVLFNQTLQLDSQFNILPDRREAATIQGRPGMGLGVLEWDKLEANYAPDIDDLPHAARPKQAWPL